MSKVFISYNRQSEGMAKTLVSDLEALGHAVWFDQALSGGQTWWDQILARVRDCDVFVFLLDSKSLNSAACQLEYSYAADLGKPILPVLVGDGVSTNLLPPELSQIQYVDYRKQDRDAAFRLARAMVAVPPPKPLPDPLPHPPGVPISYLGGLTRKVDSSATLSYEEQSALLVDLRRGLRDPDNAVDSRALLKRLRVRRDLFATIAEEIDELLGSQRKEPVAIPRPLPEPVPKVEIPQRAIPPDSIAPNVFAHPRWLGALLGLLMGSLLGVMAKIAGRLTSDKDINSAFAITVAATAITGAIVGMRSRVFVAALTGLVLGFSIWAFIDTDSRFRFARAIILGASLGEILGAIAGAILEKRKARPNPTRP